MFDNYNDDIFNQHLLKAFLFHIIVFAILYIFSHAIFSPDSQKIENIELIKSSVRIDMVALPKQTIQELKNINVAPQDVEVVKPKEKPVKSEETSEIEFKKKAPKVDVNNLLKNFSNKNLETSKKQNKKVQNPNLKKLVLEGNKVSKGTSTTGDRIDADNVFKQYAQSLPDQVRPFWKLPSYLSEKGLRCRIRVFIASDGKILRTEIFESSGELEYDNKALEAVRKTAQFSLPPKEIRGQLAAGAVSLGFPL
jgi:TonB family protein